jgi:hypothetical protein
MKQVRLTRNFAMCAAALSLAAVATTAHAQATATTASSARFTISANGQEVLDTSTKLWWRRCTEGMKWDGKTCVGKPVKLTLALAKQQAAATGKAEGKAWRIPSREELTGLIVKPQKKPLIDKNAFPNTPSAVFFALRPGFDDNLNAWIVDFGNGHVFGSTGSKYLVRLVRNG